MAVSYDAAIFCVEKSLLVPEGYNILWVSTKNNTT